MNKYMTHGFPTLCMVLKRALGEEKNIKHSSPIYIIISYYICVTITTVVEMKFQLCGGEISYHNFCCSYLLRLITGTKKLLKPIRIYI